MDDNSSATLAPGSMADGGLSIAEASAHLALTIDQIRRRARAGQLGSHQVQSKHGPAWCLHLDSPPAGSQGGTTVGATVAPEERNGGARVAPGSGIVELVTLVDRLQGENRELAATAAMWQERAGSLADRLQLAEVRIAALEAPELSQATTAGQETASGPVVTAGAPLPR